MSFDAELKLMQAIERVRKHHRKARGRNGKGWDCLGCPDGNGFFPYPCPTIQALDGEQE